MRMKAEMTADLSSGRRLLPPSAGTIQPVGQTRTDPDEKEQDVSGESDKAEGRIKQAAGDLTDNEDLKNEGKKDEAAGKVKGAVDDAKDKANSAVDSVKNKLD